MRQVVRHIKIEPAVKTETKRIAISVVAMSVVMEVVFLALGRFDSTVLFGNLLGGRLGDFKFLYHGTGCTEIREKGIAGGSKAGFAELLYQAPFGNGGDSAHRL